ncbi:hypothetical protein BDN72DRAFT_650674 [Pluteus cervinus]|uniref:Uncharacterized protein n=1 Tax=Pluteus cervinus TaxID=181527 RepID=A0ACD3AT81_9AGAR|nr:hypothetical protein BDN72DRAFT_650674 [Pluteus cervinus]
MTDLTASPVLGTSNYYLFQLYPSYVYGYVWVSDFRLIPEGGKWKDQNEISLYPRLTTIAIRGTIYDKVKCFRSQVSHQGRNQNHNYRYPLDFLFSEATPINQISKNIAIQHHDNSTPISSSTGAETRFWGTSFQSILIAPLLWFLGRVTQKLKRTPKERRAPNPWIY